MEQELPLKADCCVLAAGMLGAVFCLLEFLGVSEKRDGFIFLLDVDQRRNTCRIEGEAFNGIQMIRFLIVNNK